MFLWIVTPFGLVGRYQRLEKHTLYIFRAENGNNVLPKRWYLSTNSHDLTPQKNAIIIIFTAVNGCKNTEE